MFKAISSFRSGLSLAAVVVAGSLSLTSCIKNSDNNRGSNTPVAGLMAFNLSINQSNVGFALGGSTITASPLAYTNYTGAYSSIYTGTRTVQAFDYASNRVLAQSSQDFAANKYYSTFLFGADSSYKAVVIHDDIDTLSGATGKSYVRFVNAIPDSVHAPVVKITSVGSSVVEGPATYTTVSGFLQVSQGDLVVSVNNEFGINATRTIRLDARKVYTLLLVGNPGSTTTPVEIKFITNGQLADGAGRGVTTETTPFAPITEGSASATRVN